MSWMLELRLAWRDPTYRWVWILVISLSMVVGWQGTLRVSDWQDRHRQLADEESRRLEELASRARLLDQKGEPFAPLKDPRDPSEVGRRLGTRTFLLPPPELLVLSQGVADLWSNTRLLSADVPVFDRENLDYDDPEERLHGPLDATFLAVVVLPLAIILLGYSYRAGEVDAGRWPQLLSLITPARFAARRLAVRWLLLLAPVTSLLALFGTLAGGGGSTVALWLASLWLSLLPWFGLTLWIGSFRKSAAWCLLVLASLWLLSVALLPGLLREAHKLRYPLDSPLKAILAVRAVQAEFSEKKDQAVKDFYVDHPEVETESVLPRAERNRLRFSTYLAASLAAKPILDSRESALVNRSQDLRWAQFLSPSLVAWNLLTEQAGTSERQFRDFHQQGDRALALWIDFFEPRILAAKPFLEHQAIPQSRWVPLPRDLGALFWSWAYFIAVSLIFTTGAWRNWKRES